MDIERDMREADSRVRQEQRIETMVEMKYRKGRWETIYLPTEEKLLWRSHYS